MPEAEQTPSQRSADIRLPYRTIAIASGGISVACLTTLVIVVTITGADALASIALVLAVLAFVIQIIVFVVDSFSSARRDREASAINANTVTLLARIEEKSNATNQVVREQAGKLLDNLMARQAIAAKDEEPGAPITEARLEAINDLRSEFNRVAGPPREASGPDSRPPTARRVNALENWPSRDPTIERELEALSSDARRTLVQFAIDVLDSYERGLPEGLYFTASELQISHELRRARFVRRTELDSDAYKLAGRGLAAVRFLVAPDPIPEAFAGWEWLPEARASVANIWNRKQPIE